MLTHSPIICDLNIECCVSLTDDTVAPFHNPVVAATIAARTAAAFAEAPYQA